jgi:hypothetical protein
MVLEARELNRTEYKLTGLVNDTTYEWTVEATDGKSVSDRPEAFEFKVEIEETGGGGGGEPPPPPPPNPNQPPTATLLSPERGTEVGTLMPTLTWEGYDPDGDELTYQVAILDKDGGTLYQSIETSSYLTVPQPLVNGERYFWTVIPSDGEDEGICVSGTWYFTVNRIKQEESIPPIVNVTWDPEGEVEIGTTITFDASGSEDPDGTITLYIWTFGDGTTETGPSFSMVAHTFEDDGDFNVSLVIFDDDGKTAIWAHTVNVKAEPPPPPPPPPPSNGGLSMGQMGILLFITALAVVFGTLGAVMAYRKVRFGKYDIEQIFLVYDDGRLISHVGAGAVELEKQEKQDKEIMGGMLTAVQDFVQHSLKDKKANGSLKVLEYGDYNIVIEKGRKIFLAVFSTGNVPQELRDRMQKVIGKVQNKYGRRLERWDGDTELFKGIEFQLVDLV